MSTIDMTRVRRESVRWHLLLTLSNARPLGTFEEVLLSVVRATFADATPEEIRRDLAYLGVCRTMVFFQGRRAASEIS